MTQTQNSNNMKKSKLSYIAVIILLLLAGGTKYFGGGEEIDNYQQDEVVSSDEELVLTFRNEELLDDHYEKHGVEMGFSSAQSYEKAAAKVVQNQDVLCKTEAEDGDQVYYLESTNELVIISTDGYIRTYFCPQDGLDYFNRQ